MKLRVRIEDQTFEVEVGDLNARPVTATIEGETFEVWPETMEAIPTELKSEADVAPVAARPARAQAAPAVAKDNGGDKTRGVLAPIPGVIISISAKPGDKVTFGQELCVLEAMKMKNQIRASRAGTIAKICVETGDQVRHGQVLMEYAD